jgi:hypothetical protein
VRWAAAALLTVGAAGAALAAPGSPVLRWVTAWVARIGVRPERGPAPPAQEESARPVLAGIAVSPGERLTIVFSAPGTGGVVRVSLTDDDAVVVRAPSGSAGFTSEPDRLLVDVRHVPDTFSVTIPRGAPRVELRAGRVILIEAERGRLRPALSADSWGGYLIALPGPPRP